MSRKPKLDKAAEVARLVEANAPKIKPALDGAVGYMSRGRFLQKQIALRELIHEYDQEMIEVVLELARGSSNDFCRLAAANSLLDRSMGKAVQRTEHTERDERVLAIGVIAPELRIKMLEVVDALEAAKSEANSK